MNKIIVHGCREVYKDLEYGDVFEYEGEYYMKLCLNNDYNIINSDNITTVSVDLSTGMLHYFFKDDTSINIIFDANIVLKRGG